MIAACALTFALIAAAHDGSDGQNTKAHTAAHELMRGITITSDGPVITDPLKHSRYKRNVDWALHARLQALETVGVKVDAAMMRTLKEQARCDADERLFE